MKKFLKIILAFILTIISAFSFIACDSIFTMGWTEHGPFHYQTEAKTIKNIYQAGGRYFCDCDREYFEIVNGNLVKLKIPLDRYKDNTKWDNYWGDLRTGDNKIYVSSTYYLYQFDLDFNLIERFDLFCFDYFVKDGKVFYIGATNQTNDGHDVCCFDLSKKTIEVIYSDVKFGSVVSIDGEDYFFDKNHILTRLDKSETSFYSDPLCQNVNIERKFVVDGIIGNVSIENDNDNTVCNLKVEYNGNDYFYKLSEKTDYLYSLVKTTENKVYFATFLDEQEDDCRKTSTYVFCFCCYGKTTLWSFDVQSNEFSIVGQYDKGVYLINYGDDYVCYYKDGKIYRNDDGFKDVDIIRTKDTFIVKGEPTRTSGVYLKSTSLFYDDRYSFYYGYIERDIEKVYYE